MLKCVGINGVIKALITPLMFHVQWQNRFQCHGYTSEERNVSLTINSVHLKRKISKHSKNAFSRQKCQFDLKLTLTLTFDDIEKHIP